ncbi:MAG: ATP-dependent DNA helicase DinG [Porticoccus sp.]|nr:ATP-dependent DNA helicase DinG [Porticoccus sp.]
MIAAIANGLGEIEEDDAGDRTSDNGICVVEAGTGTGKTIAYLLSTLPIARKLGKQVVVATGTVALQEQLVNRDIPSLLKSAGWDYSVALAKGRGRYLCPLRLEQCLDAATAKDSGAFLFEDEITFNPTSHIIASYRAMDKELKQEDWPGDRDSWPESIEDVDWQPLTVDRRQCTGRRCRYIRECCFFKARDELEESECIVANHDLVMADLALGGGVILPAPENTIYIFDEGHRISTTALNHFSGQCRLKSTINWLARIQKQIAGQLPLLVNIPGMATRLEKIADAASASEKLLGISYPLFEKFLDQDDADGLSGANNSRGKNNYNGASDDVRWCFPGGDPGDDVREMAEHISEHLSTLGSLLDTLSNQVGEAMDEPHYPLPRVDLEQLFQQVGVWQGRVEGTQRLWQSYSQSDSCSSNNSAGYENTSDGSLKSPNARWLTLEQGVGGNMDICLSASPTDAGGIFQANLWQRCFGAVITSATLRTLGSFSNYQQRCGLPKYAQCTAVAGAFDFANAGILSVPDIGVDPSDARDHTDALIEKIPKLIDWDEGSLVLFSSRKQMDLVCEQLPAEYLDRVLVQGQWGNQEIVRRHKEAIDEGEGSAIFGLASFAEGMDFPGDYCRHVIIAKIPFAVPDDPVYSTLSEWLEQQGGNPFMDLMLPDASLRLHQACGRLIRTETDTGRVTILDRRIITKRYGKQLLADLPPFGRDFS